MLEDPYRWVEAVQNRREYLDDQLKNASPVGPEILKGIDTSAPDKGCLLYTSDAADE